MWLSGLATFIVGIIWLAVAAAPLQLRPWGLAVTQHMAIIGLVNGVFAMFATGSIATGLGLLVLPGLVLWYTDRDDVVVAFLGSGTR